MGGGNGSVNRLAKVAVVERGDVGRDQLALAGSERVGRMQKNLRKLVERLAVSGRKPWLANALEASGS